MEQLQMGGKMGRASLEKTCGFAKLHHLAPKLSWLTGKPINLTGGTRQIHGVEVLEDDFQGKNPEGIEEICFLDKISLGVANKWPKNEVSLTVK